MTKFNITPENKDQFKMTLTPGIYLSKSEFDKMKQVANIISNDKNIKKAEDYTIEEYAYSIFKNSMKSLFGFKVEFEALTYKENVCPPYKAYAARFASKRPLIFLLIQKDGKVVVSDEKTIDLFDNGPFNSVSI